jgi:hypothetical protein
MTMNTAIQTEVQVEETTQETAELSLRTLDGAEMILVGGGYCAADY